MDEWDSGSTAMATAGTKAAGMGMRGKLRLAAVDGARVRAAALAPDAVRPSSASARKARVVAPPPADEPHGGPITVAEVAAMDDESLSILRSLIQADLAILDAEHAARREAVEQEMRRMRRAVVDAEQRHRPGEVLVAEAGNSIAYTHSGTAWRLPPAAARQRGLPALAGRTVCYAYGRPVTEDGRSVAGGAPAVAPLMVRRATPATPDRDIPF